MTSPAPSIDTFDMKCQEDDTTAHSSWNESDDLSSYLDKDDDNELEESYSDEDYRQTSSTEALHRSILSERAAMLMRRESSIEYGTSSYVKDAASELSRLSIADAARKSVQDSTEYKEIDLGCRSKMMEWSIGVVEYSYPPPSEPSSSSGHKRKHSVETLRIISAAFSYVDRIMALSSTNSSGIKFQVRTRKQYKLLCMISLHLAAKTSGLFSRGDHEYVQDSILGSVQKRSTPSTSDETTSEDIKKNRLISSSSSMSSICTATTTCSSSHSSPQSRSTDVDDDMSKASQLHAHHPRPLLHLLSFKGLHSLSQGEFSIEEMCQMELSILSSLEWRLNGGLTLEWLGLMLECMLYCQSYCVDESESLHLNRIKELALAHLEGVIESCKPIATKPSALALAAITSALEAYDAKISDGDLWLSFLQVLNMKCRMGDLEKPTGLLTS